MIQKHAIPILEFDDNPQAVIMPNHEGLDLQLPKKCVYAFLEEEIDRYAREVRADCSANSFQPPRPIQSMSLTTRAREFVWLRHLSAPLHQPSLWIG